MIRISEQTLRDKIYACWLGKNIGGTMGAPYEGRKERLDVSGFVTPPGKPLPNDDLDLQLVWLRAVDEQGIANINPGTLAEYWLTFIGPCWNEYGVCKANMRLGFLPPLAGQINNEEWFHSNGAWIRTEIWACLHPALVERAIRYAYADACVDHGLGEGTYAAIFVAAMQSAAFVIPDVRTLIRIGLSKIPEDCRVSRSVQIVLSAYDEGAPWEEARERVVADSADLGWFQAPANVAFVILGLLYGGGDFKKSLLLAINCGDDTDCTGATAGALMGIMGGTEAIPDDWRAYIGEEIVTVSITQGIGFFPRNCAELTECVLNLLGETTRTKNALLAQGKLLQIVQTGEDGPVDPEPFFGRAFVESLPSGTPFCFEQENVLVRALVAFEKRPAVKPGETLGLSVRLLHRDLPERYCYMPEQRHYFLRWILPPGWNAEGPRDLFVTSSIWSKYAETEYSRGDFTITASENVQSVNRLLLEISTPGRPSVLTVPVTVLG